MRPPLAFVIIALSVLGFGSARAQMTETPQTMGAGAMQVRMSAISLGLAQDTVAPNQYNAQAYGTVLTTFGLTRTMDFEAGTQLYVREKIVLQGHDQTKRGLGQLNLRTKIAFWSDDNSGQQAALIPYVMLPTRSSLSGNHSVQAGIILPWSMDLAAGVKAGATIEWDELRNAADTRYDTRWYGAALIKWELGRLLSAYGEATFSDSTGGSSTAVGTLGAGATLAVSNNFKWDFETSKVVGPGRNNWTESIRFIWKL